MIPSRTRGRRSLRAPGRGRLALMTGALVASCGGQTPPLAPMEHSKPTAETSTELQARARAESARFAAAVANEAKRDRLAVEAVATEVLLDRARHVVFVLTPKLVALDLETGGERWRRDDLAGVALARAGRHLVVIGGAPARPRVAFVLPEAPERARPCELLLPAPPEADEFTVVPFDRAGRPARSRRSWRCPPSPLRACRPQRPQRRARGPSLYAPSKSPRTATGAAWSRPSSRSKRATDPAPCAGNARCRVAAQRSAARTRRSGGAGRQRAAPNRGAGAVALIRLQQERRGTRRHRPRHHPVPRRRRRVRRRALHRLRSSRPPSRRSLHRA